MFSRLESFRNPARATQNPRRIFGGSRFTDHPLLGRVDVKVEFWKFSCGDVPSRRIYTVCVMGVVWAGPGPPV